MLKQYGVEMYNCHYTSLLGDGDAKTHQRLMEVKPYASSGRDKYIQVCQFCSPHRTYREGYKIDKLECVGHLQKRLGKRLRELKVSMKGKKQTLRWYAWFGAL